MQFSIISNFRIKVKFFYLKIVFEIEQNSIDEYLIVNYQLLLLTSID